jgi:uncharacterized phiE125 gp8 family phage protein
MVDVDTNAWTTLALVREHLKFAASDTSKDEQLKSFINRSLYILERYCGKQMKSRTYTEYQDGDETDELLTKQWPIVSVTSLHDDISRAWGSDSEIESDDYVIYADQGAIRLINDETLFSIGKQNIRLIYSAGYATIPTDLEIASTSHVAYMYNKSAGEGHTSLSLGGFSKSFDLAPLPADVRQYVEPYRKRAH